MVIQMVVNTPKSMVTTIIIKTLFIFVRVEYFKKKFGGKTSTSLLSSHQCSVTSASSIKSVILDMYMEKKTLSESELVTCFPLSP